MLSYVKKTVQTKDSRHDGTVLECSHQRELPSQNVFMLAPAVAGGGFFKNLAESPAAARRVANLRSERGCETEQKFGRSRACVWNVHDGMACDDLTAEKHGRRKKKKSTEMSYTAPPRESSQTEALSLPRGGCVRAGPPQRCRLQFWRKQNRCR